MSRGAAIALAAALCACSTLRIHTDDPRARIAVDGRPLGRGEVRVRKTGPPHTASVLVTAEDGRRATAKVQRHFTFGALVGGLFTYGVGLFVFWSYPDELFVPLPARAAKTGWDEAADPWLTPPSGWEEPSAPSPGPPGAAPAPPQAPQPGPQRAPQTGPPKAPPPAASGWDVSPTP